MLKLKEVKECYYPTSLDEAVDILKETWRKGKISRWRFTHRGIPKSSN